MGGSQTLAVDVSEYNDAYQAQQVTPVEDTADKKQWQKITFP